MFNLASTASPTLSALPSSGVGEKLDSIELTASEVREVLLSLDPNKASGPDNIPGSLLKNTAAEIAPSLCKIFNLSLSHRVVPVLWKRANVTPVFKKDDPTLAGNYRPISLLCLKSVRKVRFEPLLSTLCTSIVQSATWIFTREINCYAIIRGISRHPGHGCWRSRDRCHTPRSL